MKILTNNDLQARIIENTTKKGFYNVSFKDVDSDLVLPTIKILPSLAKALEYAKKTLGLL